MNNRVLHVLKSTRAEGTPRLVLDWLKNKTINQSVIILSDTPNDLKKDFEESCTNLFFYDIENSGYRRFLKISKAVNKVCLEFKPDVVIAWPQSLGGAILLGLTSRKQNGLIHIGCYPRYDTPFQIFYNYFVYIPVLLKGGKFICASNFLTKRLMQLPGIPKKKVSKIYNAVKLERFLPGLDNLKLKIRKGAIVVANLEVFKNQLFLIDVWDELRNRGFNYTLTLVGGGSLHAELEKKVEKLNLKSLVNFTGPVNDVPNYLFRNKLFLFPTDYTEGFGTVLIEALAAGCIIIANDVPSCREVLQDGRWGHLIPFLDKNKFIDKIIMEMENENYPYDLSKLKMHLKEFETNNMIEKYVEFAKH